MAERRRAGDASERREGVLGQPAVLLGAGQRREAHEVLGEDAVGVRDRVVMGRLRANDERVGVFGRHGEDAGVGDEIIVHQHLAPGAGTVEIGRLAGRLVERQRRPHHRGVVEREPREDELPGAPGVAEAAVAAHLPARRSEGARAPARSSPAARAPAQRATSAAIISPFQSASTLSSRPGRTRGPAPLSSVPRMRASRASVRRIAARARAQPVEDVVSLQLPSAVTS